MEKPTLPARKPEPAPEARKPLPAIPQKAKPTSTPAPAAQESYLERFKIARGE